MVVVVINDLVYDRQGKRGMESEEIGVRVGSAEGLLN